MTYATGGTSAREPTVMRLPLAYRIYLIVFMCIWCTFALASLIAAAINSSPGAAIALVILVFGPSFIYGIFRVSVVLDAESLLVRNFWQRRRHIARSDVEGFRLGPISGQRSRQTIYVLLRDGTVLPLDVAGSPYVAFTGGPERLEFQMLSLQQWLDQYVPDRGYK
jgi:hypothetical protein